MEFAIKQTSALTLLLVFLCFIFIILSCENNKNNISTYNCSNALNYIGTPTSSKDRNSLAFSDLGSWFAYGFPSDPSCYGGFSGPFLMTQENGVWCSEVLSQLDLTPTRTDQHLDWNGFKVSQTSYGSHLEQVFENEQLNIVQTLVYSSPHSALITTQITNLSDNTIELVPRWKGSVFLKGSQFKRQIDAVAITSDKSAADGIIQVFGDTISSISLTDTTYAIELENFELKKGEEKQLVLAHSFIFPEYDKEEEQRQITKVAKSSQNLLQTRIRRIEERQTYQRKLPPNYWNRIRI